MAAFKCWVGVIQDLLPGTPADWKCLETGKSSLRLMLLLYNKLLTLRPLNSYVGQNLLSRDTSFIYWSKIRIVSKNLIAGTIVTES